MTPHEKEAFEAMRSILRIMLGDMEQRHSINPFEHKTAVKDALLLSEQAEEAAESEPVLDAETVKELRAISQRIHDKEHAAPDRVMKAAQAIFTKRDHRIYCEVKANN